MMAHHAAGWQDVLDIPDAAPMMGMPMMGGPAPAAAAAGAGAPALPPSLAPPCRLLLA